MLAIRLQRTGRKGHASFRVIVQDSHWSPKRGKVVHQLGSYDPHTKTAVLAKDKAEFYLSHGAQPSDRVARLLKAEGVKLPKWVELTPDKKRTIRNPDKLRKNRPAGAPEPEKPTKEAKVKADEETSVESAAPETGKEETSSEEKSVDKPTAEVSNDDTTAEETPAESTETAEIVEPEAVAEDDEKDKPEA